MKKIQLIGIIITFAIFFGIAFFLVKDSIFNSTLSKNLKLKNKDLITDISGDFDSGDFYICTVDDEKYSPDNIRLPHFLFSSNYATKANQELEKLHEDLYKEYSTLKNTNHASFIDVSYEIYRDNQYLSVVILIYRFNLDTPITKEYLTYVFNLKDLNEAKYKDVIKDLKIVNGKTFEETVKKSITSVKGYSSLDETQKQELLDKTYTNLINQINNDTVKFYVDDVGNLQLIVDVETQNNITPKIVRIKNEK